MGRVLVTASALALGATSAFAAGVERSAQSVAILFEQGNYAELNFGTASPDVSGQHYVPLPAPFAGGQSGDMLGDYTTWSLGVKTRLTDRVDLALVLDEAIGADVSYPGGVPYLYEGSVANLDNVSLTAMLRYRFENNVSLIGGARMLRTNGMVDFGPTLAAFGFDYQLDTSTETDFGYLVGVAWEKPEIAARVALTYNSEIKQTFDGTETLNGTTVTQPFSTTVPQSVNLEFQTGIAKDTLLFGSVRWVDWTAFRIDPALYRLAAGSPLVDYQNDGFTYTLGLGRKFSDAWSGAVIVGYEPGTSDAAACIAGQANECVGNLGPTDGFTSLGLVASYTMDKVKITGGLRYVWIGDAATSRGSFTDNHAVGFGVRMGISF
ncbi:MAG: outer membrane protein transport protein [Albidovulum sp.]